MEHTSLGSLAVWRHTPKSTPHARILLVHGICEHSGRYTATIDHLLNHGYEVVRFDLRGSGMSGGKRQHIEKWEDYVSDTAQVFNWICRELPSLPLIVYGHSLGGAVAAHFAKIYQKNLTALVLSAPAYLVGGAIPPIKIKVGRMLAKWIPTLKVPGGDDLSGISRDPAVIKAYYDDPLAFHFNTVKQGDEVLKALGNMPAVCREIDLPVFFVHGGADRIIRLEGSFELIKIMPGKFKTLHIVPGGFHEPHNDLDKEIYFSVLTQWLERLLKPAVISDRANAPKRSKRRPPPTTKSAE